MRRLARALAVAAFCAGLPLSAHAFSLLTIHPGTAERLNPEFSTTVENFGLSYRDAFGIAMTTWNQIGIGPVPDHNFFSTRNPVLAGGDACGKDGIQVARFAADKCGMAFGSALAVTFLHGDDGVIQEIDMLFDEGSTWDVYTGDLQPAPTGETRYDFMRVAIHELGHAAGLDHPDQDGQQVAAIMNSHVSNTDAPTADDIAGARAIAWTPAGSSLATLTVAQSGSGKGTVTSAPAGINCDDTCAAVFPVSTTITLTAHAAAGSAFAGWSGSCNTAGVVQLVANRTCVAAFTLPPVLPTDARLATIGTRATVAAGALVYGGFTVSGLATTKQNVFIVVRGPSLQTLGVTQDPLDLPGLRVFDATGTDVLNNVSGGHGVTTCPAAHPVATFYRVTRGQALGANDTCVSVSLGGGVYTFTIEPTAADTAGQVLFEVLYNPQPAPGQAASVALKTIGSRGTVAGSRTMYGGFTLAQQGQVMIAVRGPSLQTLGVTQNALVNPALRLFDATGADLLTNSDGGHTIASCPATNTTAQYYASVRGQPLESDDTCLFPRTLQGGVYTFTIDPWHAGTSGEVLFEVTFSH